MDYHRSGDILQSFHKEMVHMGSLFLSPDHYEVALDNIELMDLQSDSVGNYRLGYGLSLGILKQNQIICSFKIWNLTDLRETL